MFKNITLFFFLFTINICLEAQTDVDYFPKMLQKELGVADERNAAVKEIAIPGNIAREIYAGKFYDLIQPAGKASFRYIYTGRVKTCRTGGCSISKGPGKEKDSEYFDYFILFDSECTVQLVKIYNYQATHGQEVTSKGWLKQFVGYQGNTVLMSNKNIDAISGATISVDAITFDIVHKTDLLRQITGK